MKTLGVKEAAAVIKDFVELDRAARVDPERLHEMVFVKGVVEELGLDASNPENMAHVTTVLREHDIALHARQEYPKWVKHHKGGDVIVNDADEEKAASTKPMAEEPSPVVEPPAPVFEEPPIEDPVGEEPRTKRGQKKDVPTL